MCEMEERRIRVSHRKESFRRCQRNQRKMLSAVDRRVERTYQESSPQRSSPRAVVFDFELLHHRSQDSPPLAPPYLPISPMARAPHAARDEPLAGNPGPHFRLTPYIVLQILRSAAFLPNKVRIISYPIAEKGHTCSTRVLLEFNSAADGEEAVSTFDGLLVQLMSPTLVAYLGKGAVKTLITDATFTKEADNSEVGAGSVKARESGDPMRTSSSPAIKVAAQSCEVSFIVKAFIVTASQFPMWFEPNGRVRSLGNSDIFLELLNHKKKLGMGALGPCFRAAWFLDKTANTPNGVAHTIGLREGSCAAAEDLNSNPNPVHSETHETENYSTVSPNIDTNSTCQTGPSSFRQLSLQQSLTHTKNTSTGGYATQAQGSTRFDNNPFTPQHPVLLQRNENDTVGMKSYEHSRNVKARKKHPRRLYSSSTSSDSVTSHRHGHCHPHHCDHQHPPQQHEHQRQQERSSSSFVHVSGPDQASQKQAAANSIKQKNENDNTFKQSGVSLSAGWPVTTAALPETPPALFTALCYDSHGPLPLGWRPVYSVEYNQTYYVYRNPYTAAETTTWDRPELPVFGH